MQIDVFFQLLFRTPTGCQLSVAALQLRRRETVCQPTHSLWGPLISCLLPFQAFRHCAPMDTGNEVAEILCRNLEQKSQEQTADLSTNLSTDCVWLFVAAFPRGQQWPPVRKRKSPSGISFLFRALGPLWWKLGRQVDAFPLEREARKLGKE